MIGNSTRRQQGRAIILAAIMMISVVGMSVAFTGTAAATITAVDADAVNVVKGGQGQSVGNLQVTADSAGSSGLGQVTLPDGVTFNQSQSDLTVVQQTGSVSNLQFDDSQTLSFDYSANSSNDIDFVLREIAVDVAADYDSINFAFEADVGAQGPTPGLSVNVRNPTIAGSTDLVRGQQGVALSTLNVNAEAGPDNLVQHAAGEELTISIPSGESRFTFNTSSDLTIQNATGTGFVGNTTTVTNTEIRITPQEELADGTDNSTYAISGVTVDVTGESDGTVDPEFTSNLNLSTVPPNAAGTVEAVGSDLVNVEAPSSTINTVNDLPPGEDGVGSAQVDISDDTTAQGALAGGDNVTVELPNSAQTGITFDKRSSFAGLTNLETPSFVDDTTLTAEVSADSTGQTHDIAGIDFNVTSDATQDPVNLTVTTVATSNAESVANVTGQDGTTLSVSYPTFETNAGADLTIDNDDDGQTSQSADQAETLNLTNAQTADVVSASEDTNVTVTIPSSAGLTFDKSSSPSVTFTLDTADTPADASVTVVDSRTVNITIPSSVATSTAQGDTAAVESLDFNTTASADNDVTLSAAVNRTGVSINSENVIDVALMTPDQISESGPNTGNQPGATVSQTFTVENASSPSAGATEAFGGADVSFSLKDQPSGASATVLNQTLTTGSNGEVEVFVELGDAQGSYNVTGTLDSNANVNTTTRFDVDTAGDADSLAIYHVKNGFTEGTYSGADNEARAIVTVQDASGTNVSSNVGNIEALLTAGGNAQIANVYGTDFGTDEVTANSDGSYDFDAGSSDGKLYVNYTDTSAETVDIDATEPEGDVSGASTEQVSFFDAVTTVAVSTNNSAPVVGDTVQVNYTVSNSNGPIDVSGLAVSAGVNDTNVGTLGANGLTTDSSGQASTTFDASQTGTVTLNGISKSKKGTATLTVSQPSLDVSTNVSDVTVGNDTDVLATVTFANNGSAVEGATVNVTGAGVSVADQTTDSNGEATFSVNASSAGDITVNATATGTNAGQSTITAQQAVQPATFEVSNVQPDGVNVTKGDLINVTADIENTGGQSGTQTVGFRLDTNTDGSLDASEELVNKTKSIDAGNSTTVEFTNINTSVLPNSTVTYDHGVFSQDDNATATITVEAQTPTQGPGDITGDGDDAQDLNGDGLFEDVNGDGSADLQDLRPFFDYTTDSSNSYTAAFDFNNDGNMDLQDLRPFFNEVTSN